MKSHCYKIKILKDILMFWFAHIFKSFFYSRWGLVIHGGIDGFSRRIVFLRCSSNNKASTVASLFERAAGTYGLPSRVRADMGSENVDVERWVIFYSFLSSFKRWDLDGMSLTILYYTSSFNSCSFKAMWFSKYCTFRFYLDLDYFCV